MKDKMDIEDIVMKLVGKVEPVGETHTDDERFENLQTLTALVDGLLATIDFIGRQHGDRQEYSMQRSGGHCMKFFEYIAEEYNIKQPTTRDKE